MCFVVQLRSLGKLLIFCIDTAFPAYDALLMLSFIHA